MSGLSNDITFVSVKWFILEIFYVTVNILKKVIFGKKCGKKKNQRSRVVESGNWCTKVLLFCCKSQEQNKKVFFLKEDEMA